MISDVILEDEEVLKVKGKTIAFESPLIQLKRDSTEGGKKTEIIVDNGKFHLKGDEIAIEAPYINIFRHKDDNLLFAYSMFHLKESQQIILEAPAFLLSDPSNSNDYYSMGGANGEVFLAARGSSVKVSQGATVKIESDKEITEKSSIININASKQLTAESSDIKLQSSKNVEINAPSVKLSDNNSTNGCIDIGSKQVEVISPTIIIGPPSIMASNPKSGKEISQKRKYKVNIFSDNEINLNAPLIDLNASSIIYRSGRRSIDLIKKISELEDKIRVLEKKLKEIS